MFDRLPSLGSSSLSFPPLKGTLFLCSDLFSIHFDRHDPWISFCFVLWHWIVSLILKLVDVFDHQHWQLVFVQCLDGGCTKVAPFQDKELFSYWPSLPVHPPCGEEGIGVYCFIIRMIKQFGLVVLGKWWRHWDKKYFRWRVSTGRSKISDQGGVEGYERKLRLKRPVTMYIFEGADRSVDRVRTRMQSQIHEVLCKHSIGGSRGCSDRLRSWPLNTTVDGRKEIGSICGICIQHGVTLLLACPSEEGEIYPKRGLSLPRIGRPMEERWFSLCRARLCALSHQTRFDNKAKKPH